MNKIFNTVSETYYFSRKNDLSYTHNDYFLIKTKQYIEKKNQPDINKKKDIFFIGLVFNRKVDNAVGRNKIRRRLKSIFTMKEITAISGIVYILIAKPKITSLNFLELKELLLKEIKKVNFFINKNKENKQEIKDNSK